MHGAGWHNRTISAGRCPILSWRVRALHGWCMHPCILHTALSDALRLCLQGLQDRQHFSPWLPCSCSPRRCSAQSLTLTGPARAPRALCKHLAARTQAAMHCSGQVSHTALAAVCPLPLMLLHPSSNAKHLPETTGVNNHARKLVSLTRANVYVVQMTWQQYWEGVRRAAQQHFLQKLQTCTGCWQGAEVKVIWAWKHRCS